MLLYAMTWASQITVSCIKDLGDLF